MLTRIVAALCVALTLPAQAAAVVTSFDDIQFWTGTGSNRAALVIDWNTGTRPDSYVWGFRWNGTATGEDMFRAIAGQIAQANFPATPTNPQPDGSGDVALSLYVLSYSFGPSVDRVTYAPGGGSPSLDQDSEGFSNGFWSYWNATSAAAPTSWTESSVGFADRLLVNNAWDGWSYVPTFTGEAPTMGIAAVPEPGTLALLIIGAGIFILYRRLRHA